MTRPLLRVATYNAHSGHDAQDRLNVEAQAEELLELGADVVLVQELDHSTRRSGNVAQPELLARLAAYPFVEFGPAMLYDGGWYGNAILSREPLYGARVIPFTPVACAPNTHLDGKTRLWPQKLEPRAALLACTTLLGRPLSLLSAHLSTFPEERAHAQAQLLTVLPFGAALVGVDANTEDAAELAPLLTTLTDLTGGSPRPPTFPSPEPQFAIDWLLGRGVTTLSCERVITRATDHCALVAELTWPDQLLA